MGEAAASVSREARAAHLVVIVLLMLIVFTVFLGRKNEVIVRSEHVDLPEITALTDSCGATRRPTPFLIDLSPACGSAIPNPPVPHLSLTHPHPARG